MEITLNGKPTSIDPNSSILKLLENIKIQSDGTAVAVNGKIIKQSNFENYIINPDSRVEIIRAVGGG